jgi:hypothetical protein
MSVAETADYTSNEGIPWETVRRGGGFKCQSL